MCLLVFAKEINPEEFYPKAFSALRKSMLISLPFAWLFLKLTFPIEESLEMLLAPPLGLLIPYTFFFWLGDTLFYRMLYWTDSYFENGFFRFCGRRIAGRLGTRGRKLIESFSCCLLAFVSMKSVELPFKSPFFELSSDSNDLFIVMYAYGLIYDPNVKAF